MGEVTWEETSNSLLGEGPQKRGPTGCVARSTNKAAIGSTDKDAQAGSTVLVTYLRGAISKP